MRPLDALIEAVIPVWPPLDERDRLDVRNACIKAVRAQVGMAPLYVRLGFWGMFAAFQALSLPRLAFRGASAAGARGAALSAFSDLPIPMAAALERIVRSTALLAYFEQPAVLRAAGEAPVAQRQADYRRLRQGLAPGMMS